MLAKTKIGHHTTSCFDQLTPLPHPPPLPKNKLENFQPYFLFPKKIKNGEKTMRLKAPHKKLKYAIAIFLET